MVVTGHAGHAGHASPLPGTMVVTHHQCAGDVNGQHDDPAYGPSALTSSTPPAVLAQSPAPNGTAAAGGSSAAATSPKAALAASEAVVYHQGSRTASSSMTLLQQQPLLASYTLPSLASYPTGEYFSPLPSTPHSSSYTPATPLPRYPATYSITTMVIDYSFD